MKKKLKCKYCGTEFIQTTKFVYCPNCGADPYEELCEYSQAAGWCYNCNDKAAKEQCKRTGLCPLV